MAWREADLSATEQLTLRLRGLYEQFGYKKYHVSQFEEYSLYLQFRSFLTGGRILSFTDYDGRLLALKPDVTLSIAKHARLSQGSVKSYYIENVYRESMASGAMQEIRQMGLEYLGGDGSYAQSEALLLAKETLNAVSPAWVLELSHMGFLLGLFDALGLEGEVRARVLEEMRAKSTHGVAEVAHGAGIDAAGVDALSRLCSLSGAFTPTLQQARGLCLNPRMSMALDELARAAEAIGTDERLRLDFTLQGDMEYYDGLMLAGYIDGAPRAVLYGGRYDGLMKKLGRDVSAIGFALYLDELKCLPCTRADTDVDVLVLAAPDADAEALLKAVCELTAQGLRVRVAEQPPEGLRYSTLYRWEGGRLVC